MVSYIFTISNFILDILNTVLLKGLSGPFDAYAYALCSCLAVHLIHPVPILNFNLNTINLFVSHMEKPSMDIEQTAMMHSEKGSTGCNNGPGCEQIHDPYD